MCLDQYRDYPRAFGVVRVVLRVRRGGDDPGGVPQYPAAQGRRGGVVQAEAAVLQKKEFQLSSLFDVLFIGESPPTCTEPSVPNLSQRKLCWESMGAGMEVGSPQNLPIRVELALSPSRT